MSVTNFAETGKLPDWLLQICIRGLLLERILSLQSWTSRGSVKKREEYISKLKSSRLVVCADEANQQHYEVPSGFFRLVLGPHLKYSSCYFDRDNNDLGRAEEKMLEITAERAGVVDGMNLLDLGCGWGSLSKFLLRKYPHSRVTAVSNSVGQREFILQSVSEIDRDRLQIVTGNIADLELEGRFDRILSIEMFEHCRNYELLLRKLSRWLSPEGELFVHIFTHRSKSYLFETEGQSNWMGRYFFTGGQMPAHDLFLSFQEDLMVKESWRLSGTHYQKTAECWLANMDRNREAVMKIFSVTYGDDALVWFYRWRLFFLAVRELFGFCGGSVWGVSHYRFVRR
jgi:cyclopropane-fatty-acyl-phospholipid synthase